MADKDEIVSSNSFSNDEQSLANDALGAFTQGQYDSCLNALKKIQKNHTGDCRLMHNRAVAEFYKSGQTKVGDFKKALSKVHKVSQQSHQEDDDLSEEVTSNENSLHHYNQAILSFFLHQYSEAQSLLEPLAESTEPPYDILAILSLLAEVYLANFESEKANRLILKIEELNSKSMATQQSKQNPNNDSKDKGKNQKTQNKVLKTSQSLLLKLRCCLQLKAMKACKRELKAFSNLEISPDINPNTMQTLLIFLKSNFEFLRGNFHKAYKLLGSSPPSGSVNSAWMQNGESLLTMFYNNLGVIHFNLSKHALGSFYFGKALEENDKSMSMNQSMNTSSKKDGKHHQQSSSGSAKTLQILNMNKKFELLYNAGIQFLFSGRPSAAFDCLINAVQVFYHNPRLWLRIAECCIQSCCSIDKHEAHVPSSPVRKSKYQNTSNLYSVVGSGIHQKMIVHSVGQNWTGGGNSVMPAPTLEFASVCLQNALTILAEAGVSENDIIESRKNLKHESHSQKKSEISVKCHPTGSVSGHELSSLHASILANSAYVALCLGNNLMAYEYSKVLLQLPDISSRHRYLGKMYSAEALVSLDRISDAIQHLSSDTITDLSDTVNSSSNAGPDDNSNQSTSRPTGPKSTQCCFKSVQHAQGCMLLNQAVAHSLRSEFEKAQKLLNHFAILVPQQDVPPTAILLAVYINLHTNGLSSAIKILQHNSLPSHMNSTVMNNMQMAFRPQQPVTATGSKSFSSGAAVSPIGTTSSNGSISGSSTGSRSKASTPQPNNPLSGSVTPERVTKSSQSSAKSDSGGSKNKRGRR